MSLFNWFSNKKVDSQTATFDSSGRGHVEKTAPSALSDRLRTKPAQPFTDQAANQRTERLQRRELVYGVVRDSMTRAGVLTASFKFKVLSLDVHGYQYLIMVDLAQQGVGDPARLAEIEAMVARAAKTRHGILVTAVYWRVNDQVTVGLSPVKPSSVSESTHVSPFGLQEFSREPAALVASALPAAPSRQASQYEPLQVDEVAAFKRALASALPIAPLSASGQIIKSGPRNPTPHPDFEDTQIVSPKERSSPLSVTQYGDLN